MINRRQTWDGFASRRRFLKAGLLWLPAVTGLSAVRIMPHRRKAFRASGGGLTTGLISHWPLNEESGDRVDSVSSYTLTDSTTVGYRTGKLGNAADFVRAENDLLSYSVEGTSLDLVQHQSWTIAFWLNADALNDYDTPVLHGYNNTSYTARFRYYSGNFEFIFSSGGGSTTLQYASPSTGTWYFMAGSYNEATNAILFYVNGATDSDTNANGNTVTSWDAIQLGKPSDLNGFDGAIDSFSYWLDRALTASELDVLYNSGGGLDYPFS